MSEIRERDIYYVLDRSEVWVVDWYLDYLQDLQQ